MSAPPRLVSALLESGPVRHGFYGRRGGVSTGVFASLNCSRFSGDRPDAVDANRRRVALGLGGPPAGDAIFTNQQVHGRRVRVVDAATDPNTVFEGDGMVTRQAGVRLGVLTADCAPVLFADPQARVIGAAHAGWKGALLGVAEAVAAKMIELGARRQRIVVVIGPAIQFASYRVGPEFSARFRAESPLDCAHCFRRDSAGGEYFDLPGYLRMRIARAGITAIDALADDTYTDDRRFFSYRRSCHHRQADYGRQLSVIALD